MRRLIYLIVFAFCFISCTTTVEEVAEENNLILSVFPEAGEINDEHLKLSKMNFNYQIASTTTRYSISNYELDTLLREKSYKRSRIPVDKAIYDVKLMFKAYASYYAPYFYLGGDKVFDACKAEIVDEIKTNYDTAIPTNELLDILYSKLSLILDSHSKIGSKSVGKNKYKYYYCDIKLNRADDSYFLVDDTNLIFDSIDNPYVKVGLSMNSEGDIFYSFIQHCPNEYYHKADIAYFKDKENRIAEIKIDWIASSTIAKSKEIFSLNESEGIAYIEINSFSNKASTKDLQAFVDSGKKLRNANSIILDLRGNSGGSTNYIEAWIRNLTGKNPSAPRKKLHRVSSINSKNESSSYSLKSTNGMYLKNEIPIFVLVDYNSASSAEDAVEYFKCMENAFIIGSNTAGYLLASSNATLYLPYSKISFSVGQNMYLTFTDKNLDKVGYEPDIWIDPKDSLSAVYALIEKTIQK